VLFGQPELNAHLESPTIRQLAQRITFHYHLGALSKDDLDYYLAHRLRIAGYAGGRLFARGAVRKLYLATGGIPRLVNIMSHKALMLAYGEGRQQVEKRHVTLAASDTVAPPRAAWPWFAGAAGLALAACGITWALIK
jgi:MSHA biogenesis protein MshM